MARRAVRSDSLRSVSSQRSPHFLNKIEWSSDFSLPSQIIQEDLQSTPKPRSMHFKPEKRPMDHMVKERASAYFKLFLETSSIHGLNHLIAPRRHIVEIVIWLIIIALSALGSFFLSRITWSRYQSSPTVVSMDRDMFAWNTTFPAVTVCPEKRIDDNKLEIYLRNSKEPNKTKLEAFIRDLSNGTYKNFENMTDYNGIPPEKYLELLLNLSAPFTPALTIGIANKMISMVTTVTEMGICYAVNSQTGVYNSPEYRDANRWDMVINSDKTLEIHPLDGEIFAQVMNMSTSFEVYIHGPQEVPDISTKSLHSEESFYLKVYVTALTVYTSKNAAKLSVNQRRCRFPHENNLKHNSIYTYNMCRMECRIRLCLKYCGCVPHFYRNIGREKICDVKGLKCLSKYKDELYKLRRDSNRNKTMCACLPLCDDVNYVIQLNSRREWFLGTNLQWGMVTYPRMRYRRDIIFGFTDLLVSVGGTAGLFLGCSVLSFMEIVYFLTLRLLCYAHKSK